MKIHQLLNGPSIHLTNEEAEFVNTHDDRVKISSLDEHDQYLAQGLVRKGVYQISKDDNTLVNSLNEKPTR
jgi:hypothetical protein